MHFLEGLGEFGGSVQLGPVDLLVGDLEFEFAVEEVEGVFGVGLEVVVVGLVDADGLQA